MYIKIRTTKSVKFTMYDRVSTVSSVTSLMSATIVLQQRPLIDAAYE